MVSCDGKFGLILPLASYFPYILNKRKKHHVLFLRGTWGQPVTQEAGSVPESLRLWVGGKSVQHQLLLPLTAVASMSITRTEDQALSLVEQV